MRRRYGDSMTQKLPAQCYRGNGWTGAKIVALEMLRTQSDLSNGGKGAADRTSTLWAPKPISIVAKAVCLGMITGIQLSKHMDTYATGTWNKSDSPDFISTHHESNRCVQRLTNTLVRIAE
ncbi:hypothetical protein K439DRAFT_601776 [Ramaria rubella]|nr:hypothetical protein K439DRAFT_601776 [Ramaria rubella]